MGHVESLYTTIVHEHHLRFVALAVAVCAFGSLTATAIAKHALKPETQNSRRAWLVLAGLMTGLAVWTTHFTAMLGYRQDLDIHFDMSVAALSALIAVPLAMTGWVLGFLHRPRPLLGGGLIGCSVIVAHFIDMHALSFAGDVVHDTTAVLLAIVAGLGLGCLSGHLFSEDRGRIFVWPAAAAIAASALSVHFIAMSGVTLTAHASHAAAANMAVSSDELGVVVVSVFVGLLVVALSYAWHAESLARATAEEHRQLTMALENLRSTQDHHRAYIELNPQIAWVADPEGRVTEIAPLWADLVGLPKEEGVGDGWAQVVHPDDLPVVKNLWSAAVKDGKDEEADVRYRIRLIDGSYRWFRARARPRRNEVGEITAWYGSLEDIHEHVIAETALRQSEERYRLASLATNDVIWDWSFEEGRATWGGAHPKVLGYANLDEGTNLSWWLDRIHPDDRAHVLASQARALDSGQKFWSEEYRFLTAAGAWIDVRTRCVIVRDENMLPVRLVGSMLDITEQKRAQAELNWAAYHDHLTRLPNRALYGIRIQAAIDKACETGEKVALIILDLNNFKEMNDTLGHAAGDRVLEEVARRLPAAMPEGATVARLGGDEFAIIAPGLAAPGDYREVAEALARCFEKPVMFDELRIPIGFSAGVAIWPRDGADPGELLIAADLALYASKADLPGVVREFSPALKHASEKRSRMLIVARAGVEEDRIVPFYQPKIDLQTGQIMGWEALLRVQDNGGVLPPSAIEAAFADAEMSVRLTDRIFCRMFADLATWRAYGLDPGRIAVNVSAGDFRSPDLTRRLQNAARTHRQDLAQIDIEVTETVLIGQFGPEVARMLEELRALGVMVALDDFGTGYASLSHLQQFPVDVIKIDKSFIDRIGEDAPGGTAVIDAVLQMARRMGMQTVAEGVETIAQARYLRARGCTIGQGYLFSKAVPAEQVPAILRGNSYDHWEFGAA
ncbi:MAG: EAL domain-containing protein [Alphaproteobacteria bacterium]|nr:EAL domain-containing protein [Alphaproteobacteria bacterium]MBU1770554.1 EAL domain-containing protein [Alphaproteobacteria bacterium]